MSGARSIRRAISSRSLGVPAEWGISATIVSVVAGFRPLAGVKRVQAKRPFLCFLATQRVPFSIPSKRRLPERVPIPYDYLQLHAGTVVSPP